MDVNEIKNHIEYLERIRMNFTPHKYLKKYVKSTADIYNERHLLKSAAFDNKSIEYIVNIIVSDLTENKRFRKVECLKVLKRVIRNKSQTERFNVNLMKQLFYLYQSFIFTGSEEIQWTVSTFIKDQPLDDESIQWLIDNYEESKHIVNRLLRYPIKNDLISNWARETLSKGELQSRISELFGVLIEDNVPIDIIVENNSALMWAIYYCKCKKNKKRELILQHIDYQNYSAALEVADRLGFGEVSMELLKHFRGLLKRRDAVETMHSRCGAYAPWLSDV